MASSSTRGGIGWTLGKMSSGKVLPSLAQLSRALMVSQFLEGFKNCVDVAPGNMGQCWLWQCWGIFELDDLRGLFQSQQFWFFSPKTLASNLWIQTLFPKKKRHIIEYFIAVFLSHSPILSWRQPQPILSELYLSVFQRDLLFLTGWGLELFLLSFSVFIHLHQPGNQQKYTYKDVLILNIIRYNTSRSVVWLVKYMIISY